MVTKCVRFLKKEALYEELDHIILPVCSNSGACESKGQLEGGIDTLLKFIEDKIQIIQKAEKEKRTYSTDELNRLAQF